MRVLLLSTRVTDPTRGDPPPMHLLLRGLLELGHEVHLVCSADEPLRSYGPLTVHPVHRDRTGPLPGFAPRAMEAARASEASLVIADRAHLGLGWTVSARVGAALVPAFGEDAASQGGVVRGVRAGLERRFVRGAAACLAFGPLQLDPARAAGGTNVIVLPGVTRFEGGARPATGWLRRHLGLGEGLIAVSWGEVSPEGGTDILIEGVKVAADADADVHAVILGGDDSAIDRYEAKAQRLGIERRVHLVGAWPAGRLDAVLDEADIVVQADTRAGRTPDGFYTQLGSGRPMLVAEASGRESLAEAGSYALVPADRLGIGHGLSELAASAELRARFADRGCACVRREHTYDAAVEAVRELERVEGLQDQPAPRPAASLTE